MKDWTVTSPEGEEEITAMAASVAPSGALTFYNGSQFVAAYAAHAWTYVEGQ